MTELRYFGHATTQLTVDGVTLLTDPLLRSRVAGLVHCAPEVLREAPTQVAAILISHLHHDHLDLPSLQRFSPDTLLLVPRHGAPLLRRRGFRRVRELVPGDTVDVDGVEVQATRAVHFGFRTPLGPLGGCLGFLVTGSSRVYFAGDTQVFAEMAELGPIDLALLPIGGWGPVLGPGHMGPRAALAALQLIQPRIVVPIHWGTLVPVGFHRRTWGYQSAPARDFAALVAAAASPAQLRVLAHGATTAL